MKSSISPRCSPPGTPLGQIGVKRQLTLGNALTNSKTHFLFCHDSTRRRPTEYKGGKGKERQERRSTKRLCSTAYVSLKGNAKTDYTGEGVTERQLTITYDNSADLKVAQKTFVIMLIYSLKSN